MSHWIEDNLRPLMMTQIHYATYHYVGWKDDLPL